MSTTGALPDALPARNRFWPPVLELAARWYVFIFLNIYGLGKIAGGQFYRRGRLPDQVANTLLGNADAFDLAWTFMGYSFAYILFTGLAEVIGAWLLLREKTKLFGVAILLPVMVNIVVFDIIFLDTYGALASAAIYTLLLFVILCFNKERVEQAIRALTPKAQPGPMPERPKARMVAMAVLLMVLLFAFDQMLVNFVGHGRG
jgi:hypothetical protein